MVERHGSFQEREAAYKALLPKGFSPQRILDIGGTAASASFLHELFPHASLTVQNVRADDVEAIPGWAQRLVGRAERLATIADGSLDLIFMGEVLEHLVYVNEFLDEAARVLRPQGLLLLSTPNLASWQNRMLLLCGYSPTNYSVIPGRHLGLPGPVARRTGLGYGDHIRVFTYKGLRELFGEPPWELLGMSARNCSDASRSFRRLRRSLDVLPASMREDVFVCARRGLGIVVPAKRATSGYIGTSAEVAPA